MRSAEDIAFHVALFIAKNGSFVNYYMVLFLLIQINSLKINYLTINYNLISRLLNFSTTVVPILEEVEPLTL